VGVGREGGREGGGEGRREEGKGAVFLCEDLGGTLQE